VWKRRSRVWFVGLALQKTCDEHLRAPKDGYWRHKEPVVGKVTKIWPNNLYPEDFDWDDPDAIPPIIGVAPERDWQVRRDQDAAVLVALFRHRCLLPRSEVPDEDQVTGKAGHEADGLLTKSLIPPQYAFGGLAVAIARIRKRRWPTSAD
jgi:hypothetical protein